VPEPNEDNIEQKLLSEAAAIKAAMENYNTVLHRDYPTTAAMKEALSAESAALETKLLAAAVTQAQLTEFKREIKQMTARPPFGFSQGGDGEGDMRSVGQRLAETDQFKAFSKETGKGRYQMTIRARLRGFVETKAAGDITVPGSGITLPPYRAGVFPTVADQPLVMRDLLTVVPLTSGNAVEFLTETWTYAADYQVAEGDRKPQGSVVYAEKTANVRTIAWFVKASRQMMTDVPYFASTVDNRLIYGVLKKEDYELLWGNNAAGHLYGIMPQATALPLGVLPDITTPIDQVAAAIAYIASLNMVPTAVVLNPIDWAAMSILKTPQGIYILGGPPTAFAQPRLWGLPVALTPSMPAGQFLVGAFPPNATLFDRETASADISYENEDDFVRNMCTIRAEERIALAVYRADAFVKGALAGPYTVGKEGDAPQPPGRKEGK
jgi:HK97 family phage major capsid protein